MANADPAAVDTAASQNAQSTAKVASAPARRPRLRHYLEAGLTHMFMTGLRAMNLPMASAFGGALARSLGPLTRPWRIARRNLMRAAPETPPAERTKVVRMAFDNFGRVMAEYAHLGRLWRRRWDGIIDVDGGDGLSWAVAHRKASIVFTAHIGNWELIPMVLAARGKPCMIVYRAANNPLVDKIIADIRGNYVAAMAPKGADGLRDIVKHIQDGGTVFMVVDQKTNTGPEIPFFGRGARTGKAIARLAMKYGCKLIPAHCVRVGGPRFRIVFEQPWSVEGDAGDEGHVRRTLTRMNAKIEDWVRAAPGQWLWMHKRWPD